MGFLEFTRRAFLFHLSPKFSSFPLLSSPSRGEQHSCVLTGGSQTACTWGCTPADPLETGRSHKLRDEALAGLPRALSGAGQDVGSKQHLLQSHRVTEPRHRPRDRWLCLLHLYPFFFPSLCTFFFSYYFSFSATHTTLFLFLLCKFFSLSEKYREKV